MQQCLLYKRRNVITTHALKASIQTGLHIWTSRNGRTICLDEAQLRKSHQLQEILIRICVWFQRVCIKVVQIRIGPRPIKRRIQDGNEASLSHHPFGKILPSAE